jgi:hypothetical protein
LPTAVEFQKANATDVQLQYPTSCSTGNEQKAFESWAVVGFSLFVSSVVVCALIFAVGFCSQGNLQGDK